MKSTIMNGMKIRKPIWNAVLNSLNTKEGTTMLSGSSSLVIAPCLDISRKIVHLLVWFD